MDYAFAPGTEIRLKTLQQMLRDRTDGGALDTTLVTGQATVADFLARVDVVATKPTGNLVLGSHGNDTGWLEIDLDSAAARDVSYKVVKQAYEDAGRRMRLRIPADFYTEANGNRVPIRVLVKGCRVGRQPKFVDALKLLFGGQVPVVAPRHFFRVRPHNKTRGKKVVGLLGTFECLGYNNEITSPTALSRDDLVAKYQNEGFEQFDSTSAKPNPIPDQWDTWIPADISLTKSDGRPIKLQVALGRDVAGLKTLSDLAFFRHQIAHINIPITHPPASVKTKAGLKQELGNQPEYQPGWGPTGFPLYEQFGHTNLDDFFDSFTWTPPKKSNADPFTWVGTRHEYNVILPIVQPPMTGKDDVLLYNFFPLRGSGGTTVLTLSDTDTRLFYTTP